MAGRASGVGLRCPPSSAAPTCLPERLQVYREEGKVRQEVLFHLGRHEKPEDALGAWPAEVRHLRKIGRENQADKLEANLNKLGMLIEAKTGEGSSG